MSNLLKLASVPNFRDVAGPGYVTPRGPMRRGMLYRSNTFQVAEDDLLTLAPLRIAAIYDLRGEREIEMRPDAELRGAVWRHIGVPGLSGSLIEILDSATDMREAMLDHYRGFVRDPPKRSAFAELLSAIAVNDSPQLFHCTEGKDRTGWAAMLLQRLVGVSEEDVVSDFMLTNDLMGPSGPTLDLARRFFGDKPDAFLLPALVADTAYLDAGVAQMDSEYGGLGGYLAQGLGLGDDQLDRLQALLVS
jgi:protein-tyrosine phosphatase